MHYSPWDDIRARHPGIHVERHGLRPARAAWIPECAVILLDHGLTVAQRRSALAHEIAHIDLRHAPERAGWFGMRQEREANELAARRLISVEAFADAYAYSHDDAQLAEMLNVDVGVIHVRVRHLHPSERHHIQQRMARIEHAA